MSSRTLLALLLAPWLALAAADPVPAAPLELRLEAGSRKVSGLALGHLHLSLYLEEGRASRVLDKGRPVGLYFKGKGIFEYNSTDRAETAVFAFNVARNTPGRATDLESGPGLKAPITELLLLDEAAAAALPAEEAGSAPAGDLDEFRKPFETSFASPLAHHLALQRANAPGVKVSWTEIRSPSGHFRYAFDPAVAVVERLELLVADPTTHRGIPVTLSEQPVGWNRKRPLASPATLVKVDLDVNASAGESVRVRATETYRSNVPGLRMLVLSLVSNPLHEDLTRGGRTRQYRILSLKGEDGAELPFDHHNNQVVVALPRPLEPGKFITLTFDLEGDLLYRPSGDNYWQLGVYPWFPMPDALDGQFFTVQAAVSVPKPYQPFASGVTVERKEAADRNTLKVKLDTPTQFFSIQAGAYRLREETRDGLTVRLAAYANESARPEKLINLAFQVVDFYKKVLGPFPYPEFNIIQMNQWGYGQAPPAFMFITNEAFVRIRESDVYYDEEGIPRPVPGIQDIVSKGVNGRFAHEIAHQYWGHVVKMPNLEEQWITESFSDYSAALALRRFRGYGESYYKGEIETWKRRAEEAREASSIATANRLFTLPGMESGRKRQALVYDKGAYLLAHIHQQVGDAKFVTFLRTLLGTKGWNFATTQDVVDLLKATTGQDFTKLFDACYWGTGMPSK